MKKSGFVFIETIIVICVLTVALITLYNNYSKIITNTKELNTFDTTEYNYKTYYLMKKNNVDDGICVEIGSNFSDTGEVKICKFSNILEETNLIDSNNETLLGETIINRYNVGDTLETTPGREASLETEAVLATTEEDDRTSYYFRGAVENNYVNYSGMCWRIVRVQGDGNIKLALADENGECNAETYSTSNTTSAFINNGKTYTYKNDMKMEVYDFSFETSDIPEVLSNWAKNKSLNTTKLIKANWCVDITEKIDGHDTYYGAYRRLKNVSSANPTLKCNVEKYTNHIGILTADEVAFAGSTVYQPGTTYNYYLKTNANGYYWTMSPYGLLSEEQYSSLWIVSFDGSLAQDGVDNDIGSVRPAVVLASDVIIKSGDGTQNNPYVIKEYETEKSRELSPVEIYINNHKDQMDAYIIDYLLKQDLNENNDSLYLVEYKKEDKQNTGKYFTYISSLTY